MTESRFVGTPGVLLVLICFFLPWVTVSCENSWGSQQWTLTGYELGVGLDRVAVPDPIMFVIPFVALSAGVSLLFASSAKQLAQGQIGSAVTGIAIVALKWGIMLDSKRADVEITIEYGLWGTLLGLSMLLIGGIVAFLAIEQESHIPNLKPLSTKRRFISSDSLTLCPNCDEVVPKHASVCLHCYTKVSHKERSDQE